MSCEQARSLLAWVLRVLGGLPGPLAESLIDRAIERAKGEGDEA